MSKHIDNLQFNGEPPDVIGQKCNGLFVQHFYDGTVLSDQANVVFFCFGDVWHRIYFETGMVFWRTGQVPEIPINSTVAHGLLLNNLSELPGVVGNQLTDIAYSATSQGDVSVRFLFDSGVFLSLSYDNGADSTRIDA